MTPEEIGDWYDTHDAITGEPLTEWDKPQPHGPVIMDDRGTYICALCRRNINSETCK